MGHARPSRHVLNLAILDDAPAPGGVFVFQRPFQNIGKDFHVLVGMRRKPGARVDPIFIDDAQGAKSHMIWVVIVAKGKCVVRIEPTMIGVPTIDAFSDCNHRCSLPGHRRSGSK